MYPAISRLHRTHLGNHLSPDSELEENSDLDRYFKWFPKCLLYGPHISILPIIPSKYLFKFSKSDQNFNLDRTTSYSNKTLILLTKLHFLLSSRYRPTAKPKSNNDNGSQLPSRTTPSTMTVSVAPSPPTRYIPDRQPIALLKPPDCYYSNLMCLLTGSPQRGKDNIPQRQINLLFLLILFLTAAIFHFLLSKHSTFSRYCGCHHIAVSIVEGDRVSSQDSWMRE